MKPYHRDALAIAAVLALQPLAYIIAEAQTAETNITYAVVDRAADTKTVQSVTTITQPNGYAVRKTNSYVELAPGMHYLENGQWKESRALIEILPGGTGAIAKYGRHKVTFAPDINTDGAIDMTTADGKRLRSHILGLGYYDTTSGDVQFFAVVQHSDGLLSGTNQVIYTNAFDGVLADVRYTYRRSGFEQDVILRGQPASPTNFNMNAETTRLVVFTEFLNPPIPVKTTNAVAGTDLVDETLSFGKTKMIRGKAFPLQNAGGQPGNVPTAKSWITVSGRTFLIEEVKYRAVEEQLQALPDQSSLWNSKDSKRSRLAMSGRAKSRMLAAQQLATLHDNSVAQRKDKPTMTLASIDLPKTGYVLDYETVESGATDFTFQANTTYYIVAEGSGGVVLNGNTTIGAGAVIKSQFDGMGQGVDQYVLYQASGTLTCPTDLQNPAIFTDWCDDSVGAVISGSSSYPNANYPWVITADNSSTAWELKNVIFKQGMPAFYEMAGTGVTVHNCQFIGDTAGAVTAEDGNVYLGNVLMAGYYNEAVSVLTYGQTVTAENVTADLNGGSFCGVSGSISYKNCLLTGYGSYSGNYYSDTHVVASPAGLFASGPLGNYFLAASSSHRNVGTAPNDSQLASDLPSLTTYAPPNYNADTDTPDRGFHYPIITDADHDGMTDAWELAHFGTLNRNGTGDYDGDGVTDVQEFAANSDPNTIWFITRFSNLYVNNRTVTGTCEVSKGHPYQMAVLINNENLASATWTAYSPNFTLTLPNTDGDHKVLVAVRGRTTGFYPVQDFTELTLDRVPPVLTITNPVVSTVAKPYLQLMGYASEQLSARSYDLTNALGLVTNNNLAVTGTFFDASNFSFSTNYFQCYDVPLEVGTNTITLRVSDRAGNVTTLSTNIVLDYTGATNAPVMSFLWPSNGMYMSGNSFYIRGNISDETATMTAQCVDAANNTNQYTGIVERNGMFWVENLPLAAGTNVVYLTATDAAGNVSSTNLSVVKSSVVITVNSTAEGQDLYKPKGTVSGTISEHSYTVKVNGVTATVDVDGNWSAENVPNYGQGTATFDVIAEPPPPENSGGGGGGSGGGDDAGPTGALPTVGLGVEKELPATVILESYTYTMQTLTPCHSATMASTSKAYGVKVKRDDANGKWAFTYSGAGHYYQEYDGNQGGTSFWDRTVFEWSDQNPAGSGVTTHSFGEPTPVQSLSSETKNAPHMSPNGTGFMTHYRAKGVHWKSREPDCGSVANGTDEWREVTLSATPKEMLYTGGKASVSRKSLICITGGAEEYFQGPANWPHENAWNQTPTAVLQNASRITVGGKALGSDFKLWKVVADNSKEEVTVDVPSAKHFNGGAGASKYKPYITANGVRLDPSEIKATNCVGQKIAFRLVFDPSLPDAPTSSNYQWLLSGKYVNAKKWLAAYDGSGNYVLTSCHPDKSWSREGANGMTPPYCTFYQLIEWPLTQSETGAWWVSGGKKSAGCNAELTFANGQSVQIVESGKFQMLRPEITSVDPPSPITPGGSIVELGGPLGPMWLMLANGPMNFSVHISQNCYGKFGVTQLVKYEIGTGLPVPPFQWLQSSDGQYYLDGSSEFYSPEKDVTQACRLDDSPAVELIYYWGQYDGRWKSYVRFTPNGSDSIPITLGRIDWSWSSWAEQSAPYLDQDWAVDPTLDVVDGPTLHSDDSFPEWIRVKSGL